MKIIAIIIYAVSLATFLLLTFRLKLPDKPKQLNFGALGTLKSKSRDFYFLGIVAILIAVGSTYMLVDTVREGLNNRLAGGRVCVAV